MNKITVSISLAVLILCQVSHAEETYWNRFRGPNGTGVLEGAIPPDTLNDSTLKWKTQLPAGHSSPVVWDDRIFLTALEENRLVTIGIDRNNGNILWKQFAPEVPLEEVHRMNDNVSPTPAVDLDSVYSYFGSFGVICYDHDGNQKWQKQLPLKNRGYGTSSSPILHNDFLFLVLDDRDNTSHILVIDKKDGTTKQEIPRPLVKNSGYSTPAIWNSGEREELVVLGNANLTSYDINNGEELWWINGLSRQTIPVPIVGKDRLYVAAADRGGEGGNPSDPDLEWKGLTYFDANKDGKIVKEEMTEGFGYPMRAELPPDNPGWGWPVVSDEDKERFLERLDLNKDGGVSEEEYKEVAKSRGADSRGRQAFMSIRPGGKGDISESHVEWNVRRDIAEIPTPVLYDNKLYSIRDGGILTCFDAKDGNVIFRGRIDKAPGQYCASVIAADGKIIVSSANGVVTTLKADNQLQIISQHDFDEEIYATPAIQDNSIYIRTNNYLYAFGE